MLQTLLISTSIKNGLLLSSSGTLRFCETVHREHADVGIEWRMSLYSVFGIEYEKIDPGLTMLSAWCGVRYVPSKRAVSR